MSFSYDFLYNNTNMNYPAYTLNQEKENFGQQVYSYYPQEVHQQPYMCFDNTYSKTDPMYPGAQPTMPLFQFDSNLNEAVVLNDDNFSIATASDLYYNNTSPSLVSTAQLTPYSTPSPQINSLYAGDTSCCEGSHNYYSQEQLFAPVEVNTKVSKRKVSSITEKRHICPICSHRSKRRHNLVEHMLTHNPMRPKSFKCSHCTRPFARKYDMKRHEKIHTR
ncbi:hypothetical protein INT47_009066 [Mucor saturninus]|uniref:C2H2-type domain-containing protein n=1 Tax=Mucor saturninus TaxID=64648 RepID=A0A8H7RMS2_9FUNG|nr:hypothetical protein INT47_009066 [Mucor saturninus]